MSDYGEAGSVPVDDAAADDPPTEDEVREVQERDFPEQARTAMQNPPRPDVTEE